MQLKAHPPFVADADDKLIREAARQIGVSAQALTIRLTALGLISV